jgi:hypothetical protein
VTVVDKNRAVVCCLLATSAIMLSGKKKRKRKMCSKKWYVEMDISCDVHLLSGLIETGGEVECLEWCYGVWAGKLRELWECLSEQRSSMCEGRLERAVLRPKLLPVITAQFTQFFHQI